MTMAPLISHRTLASIVNVGAIVCLKDRAGGKRSGVLPPNFFFQLQGILQRWVLMVCLQSAPVRVPSRVPRPQSPSLATQTLHCQSPQGETRGFFPGGAKLRSDACSCGCSAEAAAVFIKLYLPPPFPDLPDPPPVGLFKADVMGLHRGADFQFKLTPFLN